MGIVRQMPSDSDLPRQPLSEAAAATLRFGKLSPMAVIGPALLIIAATAMTIQHLQSDPSVQVCDGEEMQPGDSCVSFSTNTARTYEEMVARSEARWWVTPALGGLLALVAVVFILVAVLKWRTDRRVLAGLDPERPLLLGASWPVRVSMIGIIGAVLFLSVAVFSGSHFLTDGLSWAALFPIAFAILGLINVAVAWPVHGALVQVHGDGSATVAAQGRSRDVVWGEVRLFRSGKQGSAPELRLGEETLLELEPYLIGRDSIMSAFPSSGPADAS